MKFLASLFVQQPVNILIVAITFAIGYFVLRATSFGAKKKPSALLIPAGFWGLYAAWEWIVLVRTPEANIRVDLLLIWPILLILSFWFTFRALR